MSYRTTVHHTVLRSEYNRTVGDWGRAVTRKAHQRAVATAPRRGGWKTEQLWSQHRSHFGTAFGSGGAYNLLMNLWNDASYALYVHEGTRSPITAVGERMVFPGSEINHRRAWVALRRVRGQSANPWMAEALTAAMRSEGIWAPVIDKG